MASIDALMNTKIDTLRDFRDKYLIEDVVAAEVIYFDASTVNGIKNRFQFWKNS